MSEAIIAKKAAIVDEVSEKFTAAASVVVVDYRGLTVDEVTRLRKQLRDANVEMKGGIIEGKVSSLEEITALAKLPNREGLLSMLLSVLQAPVRNVAYAVKAVADKEDGDAA